MAARQRRVVWAESASAALDEVISYIARDSRSAAVRVLTRALEVGSTLDLLAERGRVVPELNDPALRELLVYDYRLLYQVRDDSVVIVGFVHGARDFNASWQQNPEGG